MSERAMAERTNCECGLCCTQLENVSVSFGGNTVLRDINLHIHCGQLTAIIGPNGAGKSTLLRAIVGELPHGGTVRNELLHVKGAHRLVVGYVPQKLEFDPTSPVSVLDIFSAALSRRPVWLGHSGTTIQRAQRSLDRVGAGRLMRSRLGALSGGELQRVLLALALTPLPDLLLLDEPVSGVDPAGIDLFYRMVSDLRRSYHLAILLVSHDFAVAARYAERMLFLNRTIQCDGTPAEVLASDVVARTFGRVALPEPPAAAGEARP